MAEQKDKKTKHLQSARQWLSRAEESFDKDRDIRGELNLFLAQAELQHAKEIGQKQGLLTKYPAIRHGLAVVVAVTVAGSVYGMYNQTGGSNIVEPQPQIAVSQPVIPVNEKALVSLQAPVVAPITPAVRRVEEPIVQPLTRQAEPEQAKPVAVTISEQRSPLTSEEMKNLIRAASKSLRGQ